MNTLDCASCASAPNCKMARVGHICSDYSVVCSHLVIARTLALQLLGPAAFFVALRDTKETNMVVKQQEHEYVTSIKSMVAAGDEAALRGLLDNDWSLTYFIIAASHIAGDAKAVGARITNVPANARRAAVVEILVEMAQAAAGTSAVPFDDAVVVQADAEQSDADGSDDAAPQASAPARRRRRAAPTAASTHPVQAEPAAAPSGYDFDRAFNDVFAAIAALADDVKREQGTTEQTLDGHTAQLADALGAIHARVDALGYNLALFRNAMSAFEQELAINGVIGNAVFSEATADWRD